MKIDKILYDSTIKLNQPYPLVLVENKNDKKMEDQIIQMFEDIGIIKLNAHKYAIHFGDSFVHLEEGILMILAEQIKEAIRVTNKSNPYEINVKEKSNE